MLRARAQLLGARSTLEAAAQDPAALGTPNGRASTLVEVDRALAAIGAAHDRISGSVVLSLAAAVPGLRGQRSGLLGLIDDSLAAGRAGRELVVALDALAEGSRIHDGVLPLDGLGHIQEHVRGAGEAIGARTASSGGLWGPLGTARREFDEMAGASARRLTEGADALGAARTFLGADGRRRYFVALQNNAEMRDQGTVLSYVVVTLDRGRMSFDRHGSVEELPLSTPANMVLPEGTRETFGFIRPNQTWQSVNATADFALSGRLMAEMYRQASGEPVDGVIALDVPALAGLLRTVGPVAIEGVAEPITGENVGRLLLHDFYKDLGPTSDQTLRRERQSDVMRAVIGGLTTGSRDGVTLGRELGDAARGGHLRLWSADPGEEAVFERTGLGGGPATKEADRTFHVAVQNRAASKLDYFVKPAVRQDVHLTNDGNAVVRTTVTIENQAPLGAQPSYQFGRAGLTHKPGDYLAWVVLWAPAGSKPMQSAVVESGLNLSQFVVAVPAGERREVVFETLLPSALQGGELTLRLVPQARLEPMALSVNVRTEGGSISGGPTSWQGVWDRVHNLTWRIGN